MGCERLPRRVACEPGFADRWHFNKQKWGWNGRMLPGEKAAQVQAGGPDCVRQS